MNVPVHNPVQIFLAGAVLAVLLVGTGLNCTASLPMLNAQGAGRQSELFELSIRCDKAEFKSGDEIPVTFRITNISGRPLGYALRTYDRSGRMDEYMLTARDAGGVTLRDPRDGGGGFCGGACHEETLAPGMSYEKTITLNEWVLIDGPGVYTVEGVLDVRSFVNAMYDPILTASLKSGPITIRINACRKREMQAYIKGLAEKLAATEDPEIRENLIRALVFTRDAGAVPYLLQAYRDIPEANFWIRMGFSFYLPDDADITRQLCDAILEKGPDFGVFFALRDRGCSPEHIIEIIRKLLAADDPGMWEHALMGAEFNPDPCLVPSLARIARQAGKQDRLSAVRALGYFNMPEAVNVLQGLSENEDAEIQEAVRKALEQIAKEGTP